MHLGLVLGIPKRAGKSVSGDVLASQRMPYDWYKWLKFVGTGGCGPTKFLCMPRLRAGDVDMLKQWLVCIRGHA